jgi:hypothetical protein
VTLQWLQDEDRDVWTARAGDASISIYRAEISGEHFWFSIGLGMPPMFLGYHGASTMQMLQEGAEARLRLHLVRALEAMDLEVMHWHRGNAQEAARVLGGRELRDLADLAGLASQVTVDQKIDALAASADRLPAAASGGFASRASKWLSGSRAPQKMPLPQQSQVTPLTGRQALEARLLSGETVTWDDLRKTCSDGGVIDDVIHAMNHNGLIVNQGRCPKTGLALWRAK